RCDASVPTSASSERYTRTRSRASSPSLFSGSIWRLPEKRREMLASLTPRIRARTTLGSSRSSADFRTALVRTEAGSARGWAEGRAIANERIHQLSFNCQNLRRTRILSGQLDSRAAAGFFRLVERIRGEGDVADGHALDERHDALGGRGAARL